MDVKCLYVMIIIVLVTIKSTASITEKDVGACIAEVKKRFEEQQRTAKKRFNEHKTRQVNEIMEQRDERCLDLKALIQKEKNELSTIKQTAIEDHVVTMCNDTSTGYDLISNSFQSSIDEIIADYRGIVERNQTQNSIIVDRLALQYRLLEKKLDSCQQHTVKAECFDEVEDDCETTFYKKEISDVESSYYRAAERVFADFKGKVNSLYENNMRGVQYYSEEMKDCYRNLKKMNSKTDQKNNNGVSLTPLPFVVILPLMYTIFY